MSCIPNIKNLAKPEMIFFKKINYQKFENVGIDFDIFPFTTLSLIFSHAEHFSLGI